MKLAVLAAAFLAAASGAFAQSMCGGAKSTSAEAPIQVPGPTS